MVAMHSNFSLAQNTPQEGAAFQDNGLVSSDQTATTANITWPLLSGESVESLAALFYPNNKKMQRLFISKTLQLSHEIHPHLNASTISNQASLIVIPNIRLLAKHSGRIKSAPSKNINNGKQSELRMSYKLKDAAKFAPSPEKQAQYEDLVKRNELQKLALEKLNAKLAHLQQVMVALNVEAKRVQALPEPAPSVKPEPVVKTQNKLKQVGNITSKVAASPASTTEQASFMPQYLVMIIAVLILALGSFSALRFYRRRQTENIGLVEVDNFKPMAAQAFTSATDSAGHSASALTKVDFSLTASEFNGSISDADLDAIMSLDSQKEGELALEQARIYVNLNREIEAITLLKSRIEAAPFASLYHWLYLLDIYRDTKQKEEFLDYAGKLHQCFNVMAPQWESTPVPMVVASSLEEFPHIVDTLIKLWANKEKALGDTSEIKAYLDKLLIENRNSERAGFSLEVLQEIMLLRSLLDVSDKLEDED